MGILFRNKPEAVWLGGLAGGGWWLGCGGLRWASKSGKELSSADNTSAAAARVARGRQDTARKKGELLLTVVDDGSVQAVVPVQCGYCVVVVRMCRLCLLSIRFRRCAGVIREGIQPLQGWKLEMA